MAEMEQSMRIVERAFADIPGGPINVDFEGRPIDPAAYVDRGKQGKADGLLLIPITLSPNLQGQNRAALERVNAADKRVVLPPKETTYGSIEGLMNHFMLLMDGYGIRPPIGEAYFPVEGANGELGFYVVSDGSDRPYRVRCRPPCLPPLAASRPLGLPQPLLSPDGRAGDHRPPDVASRHRAGRDDGRRAHHAAHGRVPVRLRDGADATGRRPLRGASHGREGRAAGGPPRMSPAATEKILTRNFGRPDSHTLKAYLETGGYTALPKALTMEPPAILDAVKRSNLRRLGGAGFPTGTKWSVTPQGPPGPVDLVTH